MALYEFQHQVVLRHHNLFYTNTDKHFTHKPMSQGLQQWLNTWKPVILHSIQEGTHTGTSEDTLATPPDNKITSHTK